MKLKLTFLILTSLVVSFVVHSQQVDSINCKVTESVFVDSNVENGNVLYSEIERKLGDNQFAVVSHGRPGELLLNGKWLNQSEIISWLNKSLPVKTKELLIFGCSFGHGEFGQKIVDKIAKATGVVVYASDDITGLGGDWELELSSNNASIRFNKIQWQSNLQTVIVDENSETDGSFTVLQTGTYYFEVHGAEGGEGSSTTGGDGATIEASYFLQPGDVINYIVGEGGEGGISGNPPSNQGGGGGSSGIYINGTLVIVAGAGGGGDNSGGAVGFGGNSTTAGSNGSGGSAGSGGTNGAGGTNGNSNAAAGGGVNSDGDDGTSSQSTGGSSANGSFTLANGGTRSGPGSDGGNGLTGGGAGGYQYSGGGGGYSGGGSAGSGGSAGGGGSYVNNGLTSYLSSSISGGSNGSTSGANFEKGDDGYVIVRVDYFYDNDGDGIQDSDDLDDDNDGIPDSEECPSDGTFNISGGDGGSTTNFSFDNASDFYIDFDYIDNSVSILVNGLGLHSSSILQMENVGSVSGQIRLVFDSDGAYLSQPWVANSNGLPRVRVEVDAFGAVTVYGTRTTSSNALTLMRTLNSSSFNNVSFTAGANSFSIINPDDQGPDGISGTAYITGNCDVDLDGIPNYFDLDSDGDGCSDAFESGATLDETSDFQFSDLAGDADGLSPSVDANNDGTVDFAIANDYQDVSVTSCSCPYSISNDDEGDSYDDLCDQDDDNDGVLDVSEYGSCGDGESLDWNAHFFEGSDYDEGDRPGVDAAVPAMTFASTTTIAISNSENVTYRGGEAEFRVNDYLNAGSYTIYQEAFVDSRSVHIISFSEPVYNLNFTLYDVDAIDGDGHFQDYIKINLLTSSGNMYSLQSADYTTSSSNEYIGSNTFRGVDGTNGSIEFSDIQEWIVSFELIYYNGKPQDEYNTSTGTTHFTAIGDIGFCTAADSDGDGIIDAKEVDSDDDGCPDAIEAGFTYEDIHLQGSQIWEQDTTVADTGVPDGAGVSTSGFVTNAATQGPNCEAFYVLAVELNEFIAYKEESDVQLYWSTLTEKENDYFRVMWRTDNSTWQQIGKVTGAGYSEVLQEYRLLHENPEIGNNYYKIIAIDFNGDADESQTRIVNFSRDGGRILLYPNPNKDKFSLANVNLKKFQNLRIYNMQGKLVEFNYDFNGGNIDVHHQLSAGPYFLEFVYNNGENKRMKFIVK